MKLQEMIAQKKIWRAHIRRVKALPREYRIVYEEMQKYIFKIGPVGFEAGLDMLSGIVSLLEDGVKAGKDVLDVTGRDVAAFCDALVAEVPTELDAAQELAVRETAKALQKVVDKLKQKK